MKLSPGAKLKSAVSAAQVVVVRPPKVDGVLHCGGSPMLALIAAAPEGTAQLEATAPGVQVGKRYVDEETGLEVLGSKAGPGKLSFDGRELTLKDAKKLPASD